MTRGLKPTTIVAGTSPVTTVPNPPSGLSREAKAEWRKVAPVLILERKVVTVADLAALSSYCIAAGMVVQLDRELQATGHVLPNGKRNPASTALIQAMQMQLRAAAELGLTPASRSRSTLAPGAGEEDDFL